MIKYDLHCHSTASDGVLTPTELVKRAHEQGVNVLALCDHDTVMGIDEAKIEADKLGIELINGVEISTNWEEAGVPNAYEGAKALANGEVTRAHYARYLVQIGKVSNDGQAFKRYLGGGKSCFVKAEWVDIPTAIDTIHAAGGVAVIAHPMRYNMTGKWIRRLIVDFKQWGGDGMEVADSGQTKDQRQYLARLANEYDLAASLGSDFHFPCGWIELGKNLFLPEEVKPIWTLFE